MAEVTLAMLDEAVDLLRQAGERTLRWFQAPDLVVDAKGDGTPVTVADRDAERFLREQITDRWPADAVLGEEEPATMGTSGRRWIIDPIDGTKAFTCGVPLFSNLLALEDDQGIAIGVINLPALGETVYAGRGIGCFLNGSRVKVSEVTSLDRSYVSSSSFEDWPVATFSEIRDRGAFLRTWGDGYGYALVASGRIEAMADLQAEAYDLAPMSVIIGEAGGRFTDFVGEPSFSGGNGLATNGHLHDELLAILAHQGASS